MPDQIRTAVAAALDSPIFDQGFDLVDTIVAVVTEDDVTPEATRHEVAATYADQITEDLSRVDAVHLWALLDAADEGAHLYGDTGTPGTMGRIVADLFVVIERAVHVGLTARATTEEA